jgi:Flp pilus assembly protein TadD
MSTATLSVGKLMLYNPGRMNDDTIKTAFTARVDLLNRLIAELSAENSKSIAQHHLVVGMRGMGKTMLLARIAAEIRTNDDLSKRFVPLVFAEEQYSVDRLSKFWLNCLDALADASERSGDDETGKRIDEIVRTLQSHKSVGNEIIDPANDAELEAFLDVAEKLGKRPVLLVDNLQLVFERIASIEQHALRELLMRPGSPILIGASPSTPPELVDYKAAFYDYFKIHYLKPLSVDEMRAFMIKLAENSGRDDIRDKVIESPGRIKSLRELTGGAPRTAATLFHIYAEDFSTGVFADLETLLDRVTPFYKSVIEELSDQQQVVVSAIAEHWAPITARDIADLTRLPIAGVSAQLDRLEKSGFLEKVEIFGQKSAGFQIAERFFNIWFLMRSASRRRRREVEFLVRFIESFYEAEDRRRLANHLMCECDFSPDRYLLSQALAQTLDPADGEDLRRHAELDALRKQAEEARRQMESVIDFSKLEPATLEFAELREKLADLVPPDAEISPDDFAAEVLGSLQMFISKEREKLASKSNKISKGEIDAIRRSIEEERILNDSAFGTEATEWFRDRLISGKMRNFEDVADWIRSFLKAPNDKSIRLMISIIKPPIGSKLSIDVRTKIIELIEPKNEDFELWYKWGVILYNQLSWFEDAVSAFRKAISLNSSDANSWRYLGRILHMHLDRYNEAEIAYRKSIEIDNNPFGWLSLGKLLFKNLDRFVEAENAIKTAISISPDNALFWNELGILYSDHSGRYPEALSAFSKAKELSPSHSYIIDNLVFLLRDYMADLQGARNIYLSKKINFIMTFMDSRYLNDALFAAYDSNWGICSQAITKAVELIGEQFRSSTADDWFLASAVLLHLNYGDDLLSLLREIGADIKLRPWYEALSALNRGDRRYLQNIPVELRKTSEYYYDQIEKRLNALPEKTRRRPAPKPVRKKRKKSDD